MATSEERLPDLGLSAKSLARVDPHSGVELQVDWLEYGRYAGVNAAWLRGASPVALVVPLGWRPDAIHFQATEEIAQHLDSCIRPVMRRNQPKACHVRAGRVLRHDLCRELVPPGTPWHGTLLALGGG